MKYYRVCGILIGICLFSLLTVASSFAEEAKKAASGKLPSEDEFVPVEQQPELIKEVPPVYPKEAEEKKITGKVTIRALVDKKGDPVKVEVAKSSGNELLDESALEAAKQNKYKPAIQNKQPVAVWVTYVVNFKLDNDDGSKPE